MKMSYNCNVFEYFWVILFIVASIEIFSTGTILMFFILTPESLCFIKRKLLVLKPKFILKKICQIFQILCSGLVLENGCSNPYANIYYG